VNEQLMISAAIITTFTHNKRHSQSKWHFKAVRKNYKTLLPTN